MNGILDPYKRNKNNTYFNSPSPKRKPNLGKSFSENSPHQSHYNYWSSHSSPKKEAVLKKDLIIRELLEKKNELNNNYTNKFSNRTIYYDSPTNVYFKLNPNPNYKKEKNFVDLNQILSLSDFYKSLVNKSEQQNVQNVMRYYHFDSKNKILFNPILDSRNRNINKNQIQIKNSYLLNNYNSRDISHNFDEFNSTNKNIKKL